MRAYVWLVKNLESLNFTGALAVAESAVQGLPNQVAAFESMLSDNALSSVLGDSFPFQSAMSLTITSHSLLRTIPIYGRSDNNSPSFVLPV